MAQPSFENVDVLVVGAGPAGAAAALACMRRGCGRVLVVDRAVFPRPRTCAAILSPRSRGHLERVGVWGRVEAEAYAIYTTRVTAPSGRSRSMSASTAHTLARERLDQLLVGAAAAEGAAFVGGTVVTDLIEEGGAVVGVNSSAGPIRAPWTVLATGAAQALLPSRRTGDTLHTCLRRYRGVATTPHVVEVVFDAELVPGFVWLVPEDEHVTSLGIVSAPESARAPSESAHAELVARHFGTRLDAAEALGPCVTHPIACSAHVGHVARPGLLCVGEAARLASRSTGEGIAYALESGELAAISLGLGRRKHASPAWVARHYRASCIRSLGGALAAGALFSRMGGRAVEAWIRLGAW